MAKLFQQDTSMTTPLTEPHLEERNAALTKVFNPL
jgi:hypothetical protein